MHKIEENPIEVIMMRKMLAIVHSLYYMALLPRMSEFFFYKGWIHPSALEYTYSLFNINPSDYVRYAFLGIIFVLLFLLYKGYLNIIGLLILYILNLSFYTWNPMIIHEAQTLSNILLLSFFFLPLNQNYDYDQWIKNAFIAFLGVYYFFAGIKKIPDPYYIQGDALKYILAWPVISKNIDINIFIIKHFEWAIKIINYLTVFFELTFFIAIFTRVRLYYIVFGIFLHFMIYLTMDVGNFSLIMMVWYCLLVDKTVIDKFKNISRIFK